MDMAESTWALLIVLAVGFVAVAPVASADGPAPTSPDYCVVVDPDGSPAVGVQPENCVPPQ